MSDVTCMIKNRSNESMSERREYGIPSRRGKVCRVYPECITELNTVRSDFCNMVTASEEIQKMCFEKNIQNNKRDLTYIEFLQDYFYRKYKGYVTPYFELPIGNKKRMELYNQTALDCGHPEYMVDEKGNPLELNGIEDKNPDKKEESEKPVDSGVIDLLDTDGNVIAENVGSVKDSKSEAKTSEKKSEESKQKESKKESKSATDSVKKNAVTIDATKIDISCGHEKDDPERKDNYERHNKKLMAKYSDAVQENLTKFIQLCQSENRVVKLDNMKGLICATIYTNGVPEAVDCTVIKRAIDPAKIRNGFYVLTEDAGLIENNSVNPLCTVGIGINDPCLKDFLFRQLSDQDANRLVAESNVGSGFYRYISYNAFDNDEIKFAVANTHALCERLQQLNLNIRFKVLAKRTANDFDLGINDNVGLGYYATDNSKFKGLSINVQQRADGFVYYTASGEHATEFSNTVNSLGAMVFDGSVKVTPDQVTAAAEAIDSVIEAAEQVQHDAEVKQNAKKINPAEAKKSKKRTVEIPAGRN